MDVNLQNLLGAAYRFLAAVTAMAACPLASGAVAQQAAPSSNATELPVVAEFRDVVDRVSIDSILTVLRALESLGLKAPGTDALAATADWIEARYRSLGYTNITRQDVRFRSETLQNVIVTKPGTASPNRYLLLGGHYDTAAGPGVNDNGSGIAVMLEVARVLSDVDTGYSVRFVNFSGEEVGLIGSRAYVDEIVVPEAMDIVLVLNVDEVGGAAGATNDVILCERDERPPAENNAASAAYTDSLAALTRAYTSLDTRIAHAWGSDYLAFQSAGYVITGFYEANRSRFPHTADDRLVNLDPEYVTQVARATVAAALHFARADTAGALRR